MRWSAPDGRVLQGWVGGDPDGPLVAVLHGCPDTRHVAMTGDAAAREVGVRLLCVNRPGYGASSPHPSSHASVADDLVEVASALGHERFALLGMSVGGAYAVACAARHPDRVGALGLVSAQPPGTSDVPVEQLVVDLAPEFLSWRAEVGPDDPDDVALTERWLGMLPPADAHLVGRLGPAAVAASVREALVDPSGYLRDAALHVRPWAVSAADVRCPVRAWVGADDARAAGVAFFAGFGDAELVVQPGTTHLAALVAHWPEVLAALRGRYDEGAGRSAGLDG